jgi:threonine dehydrogenase-like Zn-dependent dehydrogenase
MKAIVFDGSLNYREDYPMPGPGPGEALIRVLMAGICNTDVEITKGYMGFKGVPGHEFVGIVEELNGPQRHLLGQRVVGEINCSCRSCDYCRKGLKTHCATRTTLGIAGRDGVFAEYVILPQENLWVVPTILPDEGAVLIEPLAAAFEILEQIHVKPTDRVLVLGDGKLGLLCSFVLNLYGVEVHLSGRHGPKLHIAAAQGMGTIEADDLLPAKDYDLVVEATGSPEGLELALQCVRPRGTIAMKSTMASGKEMNLSSLVVDEVSLVGSRCGSFGPALRTMAKGLIPIKPLITAIYKPDQCAAAFARAQDGDALKILFDFR